MVVRCSRYLAKEGHLTCCYECVGIRDVMEELSDSCVFDVFVYYFRYFYSKDVADAFVPK